MFNQSIPLPHGFFLSSVQWSDKSAFLEHLNNPAIHETTENIPFPYTELHADWWINHRIETTQHLGKETSFAIRTSAGYMIGAVGIGDLAVETNHVGELGYWLAQSYWGQGIMTAAVQAFSEYAFAELAVLRLWTRVFAFNMGSRRVLEKNGFRLEGILRKHIYRNGQYIDDYLYGRLQGETDGL